MHKENVSRTAAVQGLAPVAITSDTGTNSVIVDTLGYDSMKINLMAGIVTAGNATITAINESADSGMSGATAVPTARLHGNTLAGTKVDATNEVQSIGVVPIYRYVQFVVTTAGSANLLVAAPVELGDKEQAG